MTAAGRLDLQRALEGSRERLAALAGRVARVRARLAGGQADAVATGADAPRALAGAAAGGPFGGSDTRPIDDLELTFQAVDVDGAGDAGVDQDKAR